MRLCTVPLALLVLGSLASPEVSRAQTSESVAAETAEAAANLAMAERYLLHYVHRDVDALRETWADSIQLSDPAFGQSLTGADTLAVSIPAGWAGVTVETLERLHAIPSLQGVVVLLVHARGTIEFGDVMRRFDVPMTLVLTIDGDRVVRHEDYPDYPCLNRQMLAQGSAPLSYDMLPPCTG